MKILYLDAYFKPEKISGSHFAEDMRQALAKKGHTMQIYAPTPTRGVSDEVRAEYKKRKNETELDGAIKIHRFPLYREGTNSLGRAVRYAICNLQLLWFGLTAKDISIAPIGSTPPTNGLMGTAMKKLKKIPFVYIVQDLFPDSLVSTGMTKKGSLLWKIGNSVSNITYKNAAHVIVISESMKEKLIERGVPAEKISVVYNWIDTESTHPVERKDNTLFEEFSLDRDKFYVTYAGNLGNSQNVEIIADCAARMKDFEDVEFVIFGDGSEKEKLLSKIGSLNLENIKVFPMQPLDRVSEVYSLSDVSFVTCKSGVGGGAFPSKAATIMATATPIIASFDLDSDLCKMIKEQRIGECCEPENAEKATELIIKLYNDRSLIDEYGKNARKCAFERFSKDAGIGKRIEIYEKYAR